MIKLQIIGNLGKDCILKEVNGKKVINFSVANTERYKDSSGNQKEKTTWVECAYWTDRTAVADYLTKGRTVFAEGTPEADAYLNKEGQAAATLRMRVLNVQLLGTNPSDNNGSNQGNVSYAGASPSPVMKSPAASVAMEDDLPF
ncbi:MAG: single-stranded DNA-binding protein [Sphingobacteriales bacterium]|jgi:single-strand DNA-binding protein|nr:single-stranded DNA-binding protein [Sphingobacteriales bacterium]